MLTGRVSVMVISVASHISEWPLSANVWAVPWAMGLNPSLSVLLKTRSPFGAQGQHARGAAAAVAESG